MAQVPAGRRLTFAQIADYWSKEGYPPPSRAAILSELIAARWRGELVGDGPSRLDLLLELLKFRSASGSETTAGLLLLDVPDLHRFLYDRDEEPPLKETAIPVPNVPSEQWTDTNCEIAYEALAENADKFANHPLTSELAAIKLDRTEFFGWLARRGRWPPKFWGGRFSADSGEKRSPSQDRSTAKALFDLVVDGAAAHGVAPERLWEWALHAIAEEVFSVLLPGGAALNKPAPNAARWRDLIVLTRNRLAMGVDPSREKILRRILVTPEEFAPWLREVKRLLNPPEQKRKPPITEIVRDFIAHNPDSESMPWKQFLAAFKTATKRTVSERTVRDVKAGRK